MNSCSTIIFPVGKLMKEKNETKFNEIDASTYNNMATFLKVFGDETRLKILFLLNKDEYTVTELCALLIMSKSAISHQLRILKDNRMVKFRKNGKNVYFSLNDDHVSKILETTKNHILED